MNKSFITIFLFLIFLFNLVVKLNANDDTYINSSNIIYNEKNNTIELAENSKINLNNTNILIDRGIIDYNNNSFEVFGNFYLYEGLTILSGKNLKGITNLNNFSASDVSYIYNNDLKIDARAIERQNNNLYFYDNFLTPCELEGFFNCPTWSLRIDKSIYNIEEDKFNHFDTFLQIADYKVFYLPFFSHYGIKAPRKKGFLTPSIEFTIGGNQAIKTPYYFPINESSEITFKPIIFFNQNLEFLEKYELDTLYNQKFSGGNATISMNNIKNIGSENINTSLKIQTQQTLNKNQKISASGLFTNSISTTRSINEKPITFEDLYLRLENYNILKENDYAKLELSTVESFDTIKLDSIPVSPSFKYYNNIDYYNSINELDFTILKRKESNDENPNESFKIYLENKIIDNLIYDNYFITNKFIISNSFSDYYFNHNKNLNNKSYKSLINLSSSINYNKINNVVPRIKFILPIQLANSDKTINEDSKSITFNYHNQFSENRFFGNDLFDTSPRLVYGIENFFNFMNLNFNLNINQSFEINANNVYMNEINQTSKFSDYSTEASINYFDLVFKIDARIDQKKFSKKEMNYSFIIDKKYDIEFNYNETEKEAFKNNSNDTKSLNIALTKELNNNINFSYSSSLDLKNNYQPFKSTLKIGLYDECSQLDITYTNIRFNDNFNTQPEETIGLVFSLDYLGFFSYQQKTDLFFSEPGEVNYGL